MTGKRIRVAVLFGGVSSEHEVSLMSVESVLANLPQEYEVLRIGITKDGRWVEYTGKNDEITSGAWEQDKSLRTAVLSPDRSHKGFVCFNELLDEYQPAWFVHGHVHLNYDAKLPRVCTRGNTTVINATERYVFEIPDPDPDHKHKFCWKTAAK